ncbi:MULTISPECIES: AzlD family protein [unclassified Aureimonas]|uniref:AzlD family protein n=1 Tax=unclassified Aureimonas TaxID=2615206 RepID=UPI0007864305|nr:MULTISPECIES: AzlD domain-containing protein [unclassified Aureimonas]
MSETWFLILASAVLTYLTRVGGYLVLARLERVPPRLEAALDAVPAAVLTAIVMPVFIDGDMAEKVVIVLCAVFALRLSLLSTVIVGTVLVALARAAGLA